MSPSLENVNVGFHNTGRRINVITIEAKFHYKDRVKVIKGFYQGKTGRCMWYTPRSEYRSEPQYKVVLNPDKELVHIEESCLELQDA